MPGITLMTTLGINAGTVGVVKRAGGEMRPAIQILQFASNAGACSGVKAGDIIEAHISHD